MSKLVVKKKEGIFTVDEDDIIYMEKELRKIHLHTTKCDLDFYGKLSQMVSELDERFMYCHRSYVINMDEIVWMSNCEICVSPNTVIHMGRDAYGRARRIFTGYLSHKYPNREFDERMWL